MVKKYLDKIRPNFEEGGKLSAFRSVFDGMETFLLVPNATSRVGVSIHDAIDSKRIMSFVVIALLPALLWDLWKANARLDLYQDRYILLTYIHSRTVLEKQAEPRFSYHQKIEL